MSKAISRENLLPPLWVIVTVVSLIVFWVLYQLKELVVLMVVGYSIAYMIDPLLKKLQRRRIPRSWGVIIVFAIFAALLAILCLTAIPTIAREYTELSANFPGYLETAQSKLVPLLETIKGILPGQLADSINTTNPAAMLPEFGGDAVKKILSALSVALLQGYSITLTLVNLALLPFIVYYLAVDLGDIHRGVALLVPAEKRKRFNKIAAEIDVYVSGYVQGQITVATILFLLYAFALWILGVKLWFLLAVISGFGNIIPYLGFLAGIFLTSIMALVTFGDWSHLFWVWGIFAVVQLLEGSFITPWVIGSKVGLSSLLVILAICAGGSLFGLLGIFLAVPAAAALKVIFKHFHSWILSRAS